jgi:hypothetical protein
MENSVITVFEHPDDLQPGQRSIMEIYEEQIEDETRPFRLDWADAPEHDTRVLRYLDGNHRMAAVEQINQLRAESRAAFIKKYGVVEGRSRRNATAGGPSWGDGPG